MKLDLLLAAPRHRHIGDPPRLFGSRHFFQHGARPTEYWYFLGYVSYQPYLFHLSVAITIMLRLAGLPMTARLAVYLGIGIGIGIALAAVFYRAFEQPILAMRLSYRRSARHPIALRVIGTPAAMSRNGGQDLRRARCRASRADPPRSRNCG